MRLWQGLAGALLCARCLALGLQGGTACGGGSGLGVGYRST